MTGDSPFGEEGGQESISGVRSSLSKDPKAETCLTSLGTESRAGWSLTSRRERYKRGGWGRKQGQVPQDQTGRGRRLSCYSKGSAKPLYILSKMG